MNSWGRALGMGFLVWLIPFLVAFSIFSLHESSRPLFESIMAVTVTGSAVLLGILYLRRIARNQLREAVRLGVIWFVAAVAIDAPLMLLGGPMKMTFMQYMADIGITYICIPIVVTGIGFAFSRCAKSDSAISETTP